jgi:UDP-N-acetyl-2-amino-2-deoxyglucuronate dehydrogenase
MRGRAGFEDAMSDYRELLARPDIDVVSVCTPAASHAGIVLDAIRANKHVLCEKPITTTTEDARAIASAASGQPDLCVSCVFQHRDDPALQRARWLLGRQALGKVLAVHLSARARRSAAYYTDTRGQKETDGGGALMVQGIHLLDALIWLVGPVRSVSATMDTFVHAIDTEDAIKGWARLMTGAIATIDCTTCAQRDRYSIDVLGETAALHLDYRPGWARTWNLRVESQSRQSGWNMRWKAQRRFPPASRFRAGSVATLAAGRLTGNDRIAPHLGHGPHVRRFLEAIENKAPPPVSPADAARSLEAVLAFYRSAHQGEPIHISPSEP